MTFKRTSPRWRRPEVSGMRLLTVPVKPAKPAVSAEPKMEPRLLTLHQAAAYLNLNYWTVREFVAREVIPRVVIPAKRRSSEKDSTKILVDRCDLDRFIEKRKSGGEG